MTLYYDGLVNPLVRVLSPFPKGFHPPPCFTNYYNIVLRSDIFFQNSSVGLQRKLYLPPRCDSFMAGEILYSP